MGRMLLSWSSGKDSAWALHELRRKQDVEVVGLVTTFNEAFDRVAMHGVRRELVEAQANRAGIPLWPVDLPWPCSNEEYERRMRALIERAGDAGITHFAFGDLFLTDIRDYRVRMLAGTGIEPLFPLWTEPSATSALARRMIDGGLKAVLTCVDPRQCEARFAGRVFDDALLDELPAGVVACGERGEFHTFCTDGPMFVSPIHVRLGDVVERDHFCFADLLPAAAEPALTDLLTSPRSTG
jgi:uncharacterized protein (TIGR00290 family)